MSVQRGYVPGHSLLVGYQLDVTPTAAITESTDGTTPAVLAAISATDNDVVIVGYINPPNMSENLGNKKGFAAGARTAVYTAKGSPVPTLDLELRLGCIPLIQHWLALQHVALHVGIAGQASRTIRCALGSTLRLAMQSGSAQEIIGSAQFQGICVAAGPTLTADASDIAAFGVPLCWHDVRQVNIPTSAAASNDFRMALQSLVIDANNNLLPGVVRPDWGDNAVLSRTVGDLTPGTLNVNGTATFTKDMGAAYFTAAANAQLWGDITVPIQTAAAGSVFNLTIPSPTPTVRGQAAGDVNSLINFGVPFAASDLQVATS